MEMKWEVTNEEPEKKKHSFGCSFISDNGVHSLASDANTFGENGTGIKQCVYAANNWHIVGLSLAFCWRPVGKITPDSGTLLSLTVC